NEVVSLMKNKIENGDISSDDLAFVDMLMDYMTALYPVLDEQSMQMDIDQYHDKIEDDLYNTDEDMPETSLDDLLQKLTYVSDDTLDYDDLFIEEDDIPGLEHGEVDEVTLLDFEDDVELSRNWGQTYVPLSEQQSLILLDEF
ncbi:MAG TPA: hypothetical protein PLD88_12215, partial [Candidatus Berkiella sp.]|nr:hypothetical protein [Candidatus Berkiella sp.]